MLHKENSIRKIKKNNIKPGWKIIKHSFFLYPRASCFCEGFSMRVKKATKKANKHKLGRGSPKELSYKVWFQLA